MTTSRLRVGGVTLAVGILTSLAQAHAESAPASSNVSSGSFASLAESASPEPSSSAAMTEPATPLALRPTRSTAPLQLAEESSRGTLLWRLVGVSLVVGAVVYGLRRRSVSQPTNTDLVIVRRTSIGLRTELVVVNVDGQRLLLGVTPHSVQTLAVLDDADDLRQPTVSPPPESPTLGATLGTMLDAMDDNRASDRSTKRAPTPNAEAIPGQARGLASLRRHR